MNKTEFYNYLKSESIDSPLERLILDETLSIRDEIFTSDKIFQFNSDKSIFFHKCSFKSIKIYGSTNIEFVGCTIESFNATTAKSYFNKVICNVVHLNNNGLLHIGNKSEIEVLNIHDVSTKVEFEASDSNIKNIQIADPFPHGKISFDRIVCDQLKFNDCTVGEQSRLTFHLLTVRRKLIFIRSILNYTEFQSCNFSAAIHYIDDSQYHNAKFINIKWFKKIFYPKHFKLSTLDYVMTLKEKEVPFDSTNYREYYEAYREYKLIMSVAKNKADEIYFKSKEYNARYKQISFFSVHFSDKIILFLNRYSNNHGRFWMLPILWIFFLGAIFFYMFITNTSMVCNEVIQLNLISDNFAHYLIFLNPTHDINFLDSTSKIYLQDEAIVYDWSFRIINAYLIFQTISSFRRYKE